MNAVSKIKSTLLREQEPQAQTAESETKAALSKAMTAAEHILDISDQIRDDAKDELESEIGAEAVRRLYTPATGQSQDASNSNSESQRVLELRRKAATLESLKAEIEASSASLSRVLQHSSLLQQFIFKTEGEFTQFDELEQKSKRMHELVSAAAKRQADMTAKIDEQVKEIELLAATGRELRGKYDDALSQINQKDGQVEEHRTEIARLNSENARLKDVEQAMSEEIIQLKTELSELSQRSSQYKSALDQASKTQLQLENEVTKHTYKIGVLSEELAAAKTAETEALTRHKQLFENHAALKLKMEDAAGNFASTKKDLEEKLCIREKQIARQQNEIDLLRLQLSKSEEKIAVLARNTHDFHKAGVQSVAGTSCDFADREGASLTH